jgi:hypothetical protein
MFHGWLRPVLLPPVTLWETSESFIHVTPRWNTDRI